ncbi:MAG TPA: hypothetical protein VMW27_30760 [Thermoanaerobaculia bacterium]|nr:hypothetical protein [Thermoanaerobaculia bacterium]
MSEVIHSPRLGPAEGIWAYVTADITIRSSNEQFDRIDAVVTIKAENHTPDEIRLKEPYRLPARKSITATAWMVDGDNLRTIKNEKEIEVHFGNKVIPANGSLTWRIEYYRMAEVYLDGILAYDRHVEPQNEFQDVPVRKHIFYMTFVLEKPSGEGWSRLKGWRIHQRNSLRINGRRQRKAPRTTYRIDDFELDPGQDFDIRLACVYDWLGWVARAFQIVVVATITALLDERAKAILFGLWEAWTAR